MVPVFSGSVASLDVFGIYWSDAWNGGQTGVTHWGLPDENMAMQPGNWWFAFGVDDLPDGKLNGNVWYDEVTVTVPY